MGFVEGKVAEVKRLSDVIDIDFEYVGDKVFVRVTFRDIVSLNSVEKVVKDLLSVFRGYRVVDVSLVSSNFIDVYIELDKEG